MVGRIVDHPAHSVVRFGIVTTCVGDGMGTPGPFYDASTAQYGARKRATPDRSVA